MKIFCDETEREEETLTIGGQEYWGAQQFADLTQRNVGSIRVLFTKGNRIRKLKGKNINGRLYINAQELFEFPFVIVGRPFEQGDFVEQFYLEGDTLLREDKMIKREEKSGDASTSLEG